MDCIGTCKKWGIRTLLRALCLSMIVVFVAGCGDDTESDGVKISLNKEKLFLAIGQSERLIASFDPVDALNVAHTWSTGDAQIATVDETGNVTAVNTGNAVIIARALDGGNTAKCNVTVVDKIVSVTGITLDKTECELAIGGKISLHASITPENATNDNVLWTSEDNTIATVDSKGNICGVKQGETIITATTIDGEKKAICKIFVIAKGVKFSQPTLESITSNTVLVKGNINPAGVEITEMGLCYSTTQSPTIEHQKIQLLENNIEYTIKDLTSSTAYYIRFYAIVDGNVKYGSQTTFETSPAVNLSIPIFSEIYSHSATITGTINSNGSVLTETGIVYSKNSMPTITDDKVILSVENIKYTLFNLDTNTTYYVRFYVIIGDKIYYGEQGELQTNEELKTNFSAIRVYEDQLVITSKAPKGYTKVDICYGTNPNPTVVDNIKTATLNSSGDLIATLTGLNKNTTYYLRSYYKEGSKFIYGDDEVELNTIGEKNIWISGGITNSIYRIGSDYSRSLSFENSFYLKTVLDGEFYWETDSKCYLSKTSPLTSGNKVNKLYFSGNIYIIYQVVYTPTGLANPGRFTFYSNDREITHIPTGVKYYVKIPSKDRTYENDYKTIPITGYDK